MWWREEGWVSQGLFVYEARIDCENAGMTPAQFAGGLAALTAKGYYRPSDDPEYRGKYGYWNDLDRDNSEE